MGRLISKLSLRASLVISAILLTVSLFVVMAVLFDTGKRDSLLEKAQEQQATALRILTAVFSDQFSDMSVTYARNGEVEAVVWDTVPTFENHDLIDRVGAISAETATVFVWDAGENDFVRKSTNIVKPDGQRAIGTVLGKSSPVRAFMLRKETFRGEADILGKPYLTIYQPLLNSGGDVVGILYVGVDKTTINATIRADRQLNVLAAGLIILVGSLLLTYVISILLKPLTGIATVIEEVAGGNIDVKIPYTGRKDQIGAIAQKLEVFQVSLRQKAELETAQKQHDQDQAEVVEALSSHLSRLSERDLTASITTQFPEIYEQLRSDFNETVSVLNAAILDVVHSAESIGGGADNISSASDELATRTENQAATLEEAAAALDELTASVKSAAEGTKTIEKIVIEAGSEAEESAQVVSAAIAAMTEIKTSSEHISQIIGVIDDIAFQTNLLALNAGVEAARAGEAGKGFAVVASEVRALAQRSTDAAKEIKTLIGGSTKQVEQGVGLVGGAGTALSNITERVLHISELVRNMAAGAYEQAVGLEEVNIGVNQLDQVTQQNAAMVEESTAASQTLKGEALRLQHLMRDFKISQTARNRPEVPHPSGAQIAEPIQFKRSVNY